MIPNCVLGWRITYNYFCSQGSTLYPTVINSRNHTSNTKKKKNLKSYRKWLKKKERSLAFPSSITRPTADERGKLIQLKLQDNVDIKYIPSKGLVNVMMLEGHAVLNL